MDKDGFKAREAVGGFFSEFWKFAAKGNVFDLAVAVILGTAFTAIVNSLVTDIITPLLSLLTNNVNLNTYAYTVRGPVTANGTTTPPVVLGYGHLLQAGVNFILIGLSIFLMFKLVQMIRRKIQRTEAEHPETKPEPTEEAKLLIEIRDILKSK